MDIKAKLRPFYVAKMLYLAMMCCICEIKSPKER